MGLAELETALADIDRAPVPRLESRLGKSHGTHHEIPNAALSPSSTCSKIEADAAPILRVMSKDSTVYKFSQVIADGWSSPEAAPSPDVGSTRICVAARLARQVVVVIPAITVFVNR
jgi:hypothetical protein